jgi:hypothetical protein
MISKIEKFDRLNSIYSLVENYPSKFKDFIEEFISCNEEEEPNASDSTVIKTIFLYFFELLGIQQTSDLKQILTKVLTFNTEQQWDKFFLESNPENMVNFDRLQLLSNEKEGVNHKKQFKRFCKILITGLIDMYPTRDNLLVKIIDKVSILAQSKIRLIRFGFTFIALNITKVLLN